MNETSVTMVERGCADCLLRALSTLQAPEPEERVRTVDPDAAIEFQLEQLERSFGPAWKW